jgi:hypothetical protein
MAAVLPLIVSRGKYYIWLIHEGSFILKCFMAAVLYRNVSNDVNFRSDFFLGGWIIKGCFMTTVLSRIVLWGKYYLGLFHDGSFISDCFMTAVKSQSITYRQFNLGLFHGESNVSDNFLMVVFSRIVSLQQYHLGLFYVISWILTWHIFFISDCFLSAVVSRIV